MAKLDSTTQHESSATKNVPNTGIVSKKRKKKRSRAQMAKKFARQRTVTGHLDKDIFQYMIGISNTLRTDFASISDKKLFVKNVFEEMKDHEIQCACNQVASRVIESLLQYADINVIQEIIQKLESSLRQLTCDKYASYVLQKIIVICADRGNRVPVESTEATVKTESVDKNVDKNESESPDDEDIVMKISPTDVKTYNDIVLKLSKYFLNNIEEFIFEVYANHVLRTVMQCLAGLIDTSSDADKKSKSHLASRRPVIQEYKDLLIQSCQRLQKWPMFREFGSKDSTSGFVQCMLLALKEVDEKLVNKIIKESLLKFQDENQSAIFNLESSVRLLETCLMTSTPKTYSKLYKTFFADNLECLCQNQNTNYSVQRLLDSCPMQDVFDELFDKLEEHFPKILKRGFTGILLSTANACLRLHTKQGPFVKEMINMLDCMDYPHFILCIMTLKTRSELEALPSDAQLPLHLHGSLITQAMLKFNKPIKIVKSLLALNKEKLAQIFDDPKGSRIVDAFIDSEYIGEKSREQLCKSLNGVWVDLTKSVHGSRCVDKIWQKLNMKQKLNIMYELVAAGQSIRSTKSGQVMYTKLKVAAFVKDKNDWISSRERQEKIKMQFTNIISKTPKNT